MATKTALNHTESQLQSLRTIHDVKFDKRSNSLLQRDGSEFGIRAADSGSMAVASNCTKDVKQKTHSSCHDHSMFAVCRLFIPFPSFPFPVKGSQILPGQCSIGHDGTHMYIYICFVHAYHSLHSGNQLWMACERVIVCRFNDP